MFAQHAQRVPASRQWAAALVLVAGLSAAGLAAAAAPAAGQTQPLPARAAQFELDTEYAAPSGDPLLHHTAGFAKTLCSAVFITGLDPDFAAANIGFFTGPYRHRRHVVERVIDREDQAVHLTLANGVTRTARYVGGQGCVALPLGESV